MQHLSGFTNVENSTRLMVTGTPMVHDSGVAVVAPDTVRGSLETIERRLNSKGLRVVDMPWAEVDPATGELVVPEPLVALSEDSLSAIGDLVPGPRREEKTIAPGRYPLAGWGFMMNEGSPPLTRSTAVFWASSLLVGFGSLGAQACLDGLADTLARIAPTSLVWGQAEELVSPLAALVS
jgi:hypothetical protein